VGRALVVLRLAGRDLRGATPGQVGAGLSASQLLPALAGALVGIPGGIGLFAAVSSDATTVPSAWWLLATVVGTMLAIGGLTAIPARIGLDRARFTRAG
jgi:putative ABC transport system permease protein